VKKSDPASFKPLSSSISFQKWPPIFCRLLRKLLPIFSARLKNALLQQEPELLNLVLTWERPTEGLFLGNHLGLKTNQKK
jgi:hypothetical protein